MGDGEIAAGGPGIRRGGEGELVRDARSLSMLITEASVNHDRPGARAGKVGKLLRSLARDDVGRGIKAVINYAITRSYLKIKTVFLTSMRLTDDSCHRFLAAVAPLSSSRVSFHVSLAQLSVFADFQGSANPIVGCAKDARLRISLFLARARAPGHPGFSSIFDPLHFSLSRGPHAGLFVTPVFPGISDLELIFVGRKLCRSHP